MLPGNCYQAVEEILPTSVVFHRDHAQRLPMFFGEDRAGHMSSPIQAWYALHRHEAGRWIASGDQRSTEDLRLR